MPQIKSDEKAKIKLKMIDILINEPTISMNQLSKRCGVCRATARSYRDDIQHKIDVSANIHHKDSSQISFIYFRYNLDYLWEKLKNNFSW